MLGIELFDVASNFLTWHRTFRRGVEMFDVGHRNVAGECLRAAPTFLHSHMVAYVREAIRAALQSSSAATAKPCLGWLHFFAGDVESQVLPKMARGQQIFGEAYAPELVDWKAARLASG